MASVEPPAANGTITVMLRSGKSAAAGMALATKAIVAMAVLTTPETGCFAMGRYALRGLQ
jgi:hypothetical protein